MTNRRDASGDEHVQQPGKEVMRSTAVTRSLFKADAAFEAIFGTVLVTGALSDVLTRSDIPVGQTVILCVGASFLLASASQLVYFVNSPRRVLLELAIGNVGMATAGLTWLLADHRFSIAGATLLCVAIAWKLAIGLLQTRSLRPEALQ
jgi:hypothetical protein